MPPQRTVSLRAVVAAAALLLAVGVPSPAAGDGSCHKSCGREVAACRRAECSSLAGDARRGCAERCRARSTCTVPGSAIRTIAYVVTECRSDSADPEEGRSSFAQKLVVRRGNCDPITIKEFRRDAVPEPGICRLFGNFRVGSESVQAGLFQRIGVLPDGSGVVFEVTNEFSIYPLLTGDLPDTEKGIFFVHADGSGLRRLGAATHAATFTSGSINETFFSVSPDQRTIAFSDLGPGADGLPALQIFTIDLASGERRQVTRLTVRGPSEDTPSVGFPSFIDDRTIVFEVTFAPYAGEVSYSVRTDGTDLRALPSVIAIPGATVIPRFDVTKGGTHVAHVSIEGPPMDPNPIDPDHVREIFLFDHENALQLTNLRHYDTHLPVLGHGRVFFISSADPLGTNPGRICQIFSTDLLASRLRQLTRFEEQGRPSPGCTYLLGAACTNTSGIRVDPVSGAVLFTANCDPFGTNPYGDQIFAMRPDGSGLRQLTALRGMQTFPDGSVLVELPGPLNYSAQAP